MTRQQQGPDEDWPDDAWPDDEDDADDEDDDAASPQWWLPSGWPESTAPPGPAGRVSRWPRWARLTLVAVVGLAAGAGATYVVRDIGSGSPATISQPQAGNSTSAGGLQAPGGALPLGGSGTLMIGGRVQAVSPTSITIAAGPRAVTATVTSATRFTGRVTRIGQVRVGDMVVAQIAESNSRGSVVSLQDPASLP